MKDEQEPIAHPQSLLEETYETVNAYYNKNKADPLLRAIYRGRLYFLSRMIEINKRIHTTKAIPNSKRR